MSECIPTPTVVVDRLGAHGDGIIDTAAGQTFLPFALPGETWRHPDAGGTPVPLLPQAHLSPDRVTPACPHFGTCGGCVAQHMAPRLYAEWKRAIVVEAFRQRGLEPQIAPLVAVAAQSRRRAAFTAVRVASGVHLGYHARASHTVCDLQACLVLAPRIEAALPGLRDLCDLLLPRTAAAELRLTVTLARHGLDVAVTGLERRINPRTRTQVIALAQQARLQRLLLDGDPVLAGAAPIVTLSRGDGTGIDVTLPDTAFLQAVPQAEAEIVRLVVDAIGAMPSKKAVIADLFCGLGTFTFALAKTARIFSVDGDATAIDALAAAARHMQGAKPIEARRRDLFRDPLSERELMAFAAVVLDPPRAGAAAQVVALATSRVPVIVMVSCNPATLARDVRTLVDGGYNLGPVTPIDQFVFSAHVEAVTVLRR